MSSSRQFLLAGERAGLCGGSHVARDALARHAESGIVIDGRTLAGKAMSPALIAEGRRVFRFDTFGDHQLWTDTLGLHKVIEQDVDPMTGSPSG
jgi:hypothetical protein